MKIFRLIIRSGQMKLITIFIVLFFLLLITSCGSALNVYVKNGTEFNKKSSITVVGGDDKTGTKGKLEYLLLSNGFNIVSESTARTAIKHKEKLQYTNEINNKLKSETYSVKEFNSTYVLELNYTYDDDGGWCYDTFYAKVTDVNTGEVVLTATFSGSEYVTSVLNELVDKMNQNLK